VKDQGYDSFIIQASFTLIIIWWS